MSTSRFWGALVLALAVIGCGDDADDTGDAGVGFVATAIAGGGASGPGLDGVLDVFVVDGATVIEGAEVFLGVAPDTRSIGVTDASGRVQHLEAGLAGPQVITVVAAGKVTSTWYGVTTSSVTVAVRSPTPTIATATVEGTVPALASLPAPGTNEYYVGVVDFGQLPQMISLYPGAPIVQPMGIDYPENYVYRDSTTTDADFSLTSRTGEPVVFVTILRGNDQGTIDDRSDDTFDVVGIGLEQDPLVLMGGATVTGVELEEVPAGELTPTNVVAMGVPAAFLESRAVPGIELEASRGVMLYPSPFGRPTASFLTPGPAVTGLDGALYWGIGRARNDLARQSVVAFQRDITSPDGIVGPSDINVSTFIEAPSGVTFNAGAYEITNPAATLWIQLEVEQADAPVWDVLALDGRTQLVAPSDLVALPTGAVEATVHALQVDARTGFEISATFLDLIARSTLANEPLTIP